MQVHAVIDSEQANAEGCNAGGGHPFPQKRQMRRGVEYIVGCGIEHNGGRKNSNQSQGHRGGAGGGGHECKRPQAEDCESHQSIDVCQLYRIGGQRRLIHAKGFGYHLSARLVAEQEIQPPLTDFLS